MSLCHAQSSSKHTHLNHQQTVSLSPLCFWLLSIKISNHHGLGHCGAIANQSLTLSHSETDRDTDRLRHIQTDTETDRQTSNRQRQTQKQRCTEIHTSIQTDRKIGIQMATQTDRQMGINRQIEGWEAWNSGCDRFRTPRFKGLVLFQQRVEAHRILCAFLCPRQQDTIPEKPMSLHALLKLVFLWRKKTVPLTWKKRAGHNVRENRNIAGPACVQIRENLFDIPHGQVPAGSTPISHIPIPHLSLIYGWTLVFIVCALCLTGSVEGKCKLTLFSFFSWCHVTSCVRLQRWFIPAPKMNVWVPISTFWTFSCVWAVQNDIVTRQLIVSFLCCVVRVSPPPGVICPPDGKAPRWFMFSRSRHQEPWL